LNVAVADLHLLVLLGLNFWKNDIIAGIMWSKNDNQYSSYIIFVWLSSGICWCLSTSEALTISISWLGITIIWSCKNYFISNAFLMLEISIFSWILFLSDKYGVCRVLLLVSWSRMLWNICWSLDKLGSHLLFCLVCKL